MTLEVAGCDPIEEPTEDDIRTGLAKVFQSSSEFLILNSTSYCYVQAARASERGLLLEYWDGPDTPIYRADRDNVTVDEARIVFQEFADERPGWKNTLVWSPVFQPGADPSLVEEVVQPEEEKYPLLKRIKWPSIVSAVFMLVIGMILIRRKGDNSTFLGMEGKTFLMFAGQLLLVGNLHDLTEWRKFRWYERGHPFWAVVIALSITLAWIGSHVQK